MRIAVPRLQTTQFSQKLADITIVELYDIYLLQGFVGISNIIELNTSTSPETHCHYRKQMETNTKISVRGCVMLRFRDMPFGRKMERLALFVATVSTDSVVFIAKLPV